MESRMGTSEFVIIDGEGFEGFATVAELPDEEFIEALQQSIDKEEVMIMKNKKKFEEDMKGSSLTTHEGVWRQLGLDIPRQHLIVDGHDTAELSLQRVLDVMEILVTETAASRETYKRSNPSMPQPTPVAAVKQTIFQWLYSLLPSFSGFSFFHYQESILKGTATNIPAEAYVLVPTNVSPKEATLLASEYGSVMLRSMQEGVWEKEGVKRVSDDFEDMIKSMQGVANPQGGGGGGVPEFSKNASSEVREKVDALALFCQQGVLGSVFEIINAQYQSQNCGVHITGGTHGSMNVDVHQGKNLQGEPDILISIKKAFNLFQITEGPARPICTIFTEVDACLFSAEPVSLTTKICSDDILRKSIKKQ